MHTLTLPNDGQYPSSPITVERSGEHTTYTLTLSTYFEDRQQELQRAVHTVAQAHHQGQRVSTLRLMIDAQLPDLVGIRRVYGAYSEMNRRLSDLFHNVDEVQELQVWRHHIILKT